jgi:glucokinase
VILAGDIGGTKSLLLLATVRAGRVTPVLERRYLAADHADFSAMLVRFLDEYRAQGGRKAHLSSACFGAAGPATEKRIQMTNLPWALDAGAIASRFDIGQVRLVNDFEAAAAGVEALGPEDIVVLQRGEPLAQAARVVIGAGTGLGVAYALPEGKSYRIIAGEGGHAGFAPADAEQMRLWQALHAQFGRVSVEHVVCGAGLARIYEILSAGLPQAQELRESLRSEGPAAITRHALERNDALCARALDLFIACYGAAAGDHALALMARGGVYIAGGIARKIISRLAAGGFMAAFNAKGAHARLNLKVPVRVVMTERLGLLGAALIAARGK